MTFFGLFNVKAILIDTQLWNYLTHKWELKEVYSFPKGIIPKLNIKVRQEFKLTYYKVEVQQF